MKGTLKIFILLFIMLIIFGGGFAHASSDKTVPIEIIKLTKEDRLFLNELGVLKVLVDDNFPPISYYDEESGKFSGIAVDVLKILSRKLQFEYEIIRDPSLFWAAKLNKIKNSEVQILGGASRNVERQEYGIFTDLEYFKVNYAIIGSISNTISINQLSDIKYYKVGLVNGVTINKYILDFLNENTYVTYFETKEDAFSALNRHEIDLFPNNEAVFKEEFFKGKRFNFEMVFSIREVEKKYAFFCPKTEEGKHLVKILNKGMQNINLSKVISNRYNNKSIFSFYKEYTNDLQQSINYRNILLFLMAASFVLALSIMLVLKHQTKQKERLIAELKNALLEVKTLRGIIPICSYCKEIRDGEGVWNQLEAYIHSHSDAEFTHGVCPKCYKKEMEKIEYANSKLANKHHSPG